MKKTLLLAQAFISFFMALSMTGIFGFIQNGWSTSFPYIWLQHFTAAWPIAFILSIPIGKLGFYLAHKISRA